MDVVSDVQYTLYSPSLKLTMRFPDSVSKVGLLPQYRMSAVANLGCRQYQVEKAQNRQYTAILNIEGQKLEMHEMT